MYKYEKVKFENMLRYNGLIACEHELLVEELNKQPIMFASLLSKLGAYYSDTEVKEIFLDCTWYNVIREKAKVVKLDEYKKSLYDEDEYSYFDFEDELEDIFEDDPDYKKLESVFDSIDSKVEEKISKIGIDIPYGDLFKMIYDLCKDEEDKSDEYIVEFDFPKCKNINREDVDMCLKYYMCKGGKVYYNGEIVGSAVSFNDSKIKIKLNTNITNLDSVIIDFEFIRYERNKVIILDKISIIDNIDENDYIIKLKKPESVYHLSKDEFNKCLNDYIECNAKVFLLNGSTTVLIGDMISNNENTVTVKVENEELLRKIKHQTNMNLEIALSKNDKDYYLSTTYIQSIKEGYMNLEMVDKDISDTLKCILKGLMDDYISNDGNLYLEGDYFGTVIDYKLDFSKMKIRLTDNKTILDKFNTYKNPKIDINVRMGNGDLEVEEVFIIDEK